MSVVEDVPLGSLGLVGVDNDDNDDDPCTLR